MKRLIIVFALLTTPAFATDLPTVSLTQDEVAHLIDMSIAQYAAKQAEAAAKSAITKYNTAFAPPPSPEPKPE